MNTETKSARRYHWHSAEVKDLMVEPHSGIMSESRTQTLNLTAKESVPVQKISTELVQGNYNSLMKDVAVLARHSSELSQMVKLKKGGETLTLLNLEHREFHRHPVMHEEFKNSKYLEKIFARVTERQPEDYETLVSLEGVGARTLRALALVSEVIYGAAPSYTDPARYSFAHGGKDGTPRPVDQKSYDTTIEFFQKILPKLKVEIEEKKLMETRLLSL
jgi:hypothetical protein